MTSFTHLTLILLPHYLVKCQSRCLAVYKNVIKGWFVTYNVQVQVGLDIIFVNCKS